MLENFAEEMIPPIRFLSISKIRSLNREYAGYLSCPVPATLKVSESGSLAYS